MTERRPLLLRRRRQLGYFWCLYLVHEYSKTSRAFVPSEISLRRRIQPNYIDGSVYHSFSDIRNQRAFSVLQATSSRNLKAEQQKNHKSNRINPSRSLDQQQHKNRASQKKDKSTDAVECHGVVQRLAMAAAQAAAAAANSPEDNVTSTDASIYPSDNTNSHHLGSLTQLTKAIDQQLDANQRGSSPFVNGHMVRRVRDSMSSLLVHNNNQQEIQPSTSATTTYHVAVVFGKPLVRDQVSVEYASRIRCLVQLLLSQEETNNDDSDDMVHPISLVCFCGGNKSNSKYVSTVDAGYVYFRHLCAAQDVSLEHVEFLMDRMSLQEERSLKAFVQHLQHHYVPQWMATSLDKKIRVHWTLISSDYHLCNLNDIHQRSPNQSWLRPMESWTKEYNSVSVMQYAWEAEEDHEDEQLWDDDEIEERSWNTRLEQRRTRHKTIRPRQTKGTVETSWSYRYTTYPYIYAKEDAAAFLGKCYLLGEELVPLLVNLKGVVEDKEFFQRDNFLVLTSVRRTLVTYMEKLYGKQPFLRTELAEEDTNIVLEGAVLALGRSMDLLRPAGLLVGSVAKSDYVKALKLVEHAVRQIRTCCDPDEALDPWEWGKLGSDEDALVIHPELEAESLKNRTQELDEISSLAEPLEQSTSEEVEKQVSEGETGNGVARHMKQ